ncbi:MAG TPA: triose-phosphate isomerase [Woeseiaceae bacterium]|nr:triose-phosphate isomerase [Woeseiaceae bacterium]
MRKYLVAGNWKMNGGTAANSELCGLIAAGAPASRNIELLVCPPFPYLEATKRMLEGSSVTLGAQNVSQYAAGAYTGEVSAGMLRDVGCKYVIVGHSERRAMMHETSDIVAEKFKAVLGEQLTPILCVGETLEERTSGRMEEVVGTQLRAVLDAAGIGAFGSAVIAYEPVWAIGTGQTASPEQAQEVHGYIRNILAGQDVDIADAVQILYGGSVKGDNATGLFSMPDIDGGLIGGASLKAAEFLAIAEAAKSQN